MRQLEFVNRKGRSYHGRAYSGDGCVARQSRHVKYTRIVFLRIRPPYVGNALFQFPETGAVDTWRSLHLTKAFWHSRGGGEVP